MRSISRLLLDEEAVLRRPPGGQQLGLFEHGLGGFSCLSRG